MGNRSDWDAAFKTLQEEQALGDKVDQLTDAIITGRLSMLFQAEKALEEGATLEQFAQVFTEIIVQEIIRGAVDAGTFTIPQAFADLDADQPEI